MKHALLILALVAVEANALGMAGIAARGGIHRRCDDACLYRLDQAEERRAAEQRAAELKREEQQRRMQEYKQRPDYRGPKPMVYGQHPGYTPPPAKPPGPHAERMGTVNILKDKP